MKVHGIVANFVVAIAALSVSGITWAEHKDGHEKGKGPKSSIEIINTCTVNADNSRTVEPPRHVLQVVTEIKDVSDDNSEGYTISSKSADGQQLVKSSMPPKKASWGPVGATNSTLESEGQLTFEILLCEGMYKLNDDASVLNATVQVMTVDGANVISRCDDIDGTDKDESIVLPVDKYGKRISCTVPTL